MSVHAQELAVARSAWMKERDALDRAHRVRLMETEQRAYKLGVRDGIKEAQPFASFVVGTVFGSVLGAFAALNWHSLAAFFHIA